MVYDVKKFLQDNKIHFKSSGTNVSAGWIEIHCPFPICKDPSEHMGINLTSSMFNCWKCGEHGSFTKLVKVILKCGWKQAEDISSEYFKPSLLSSATVTQRTTHSFAFPKEATDVLSELHKTYLRNRGFSPKEIKQKYGVMACYTTGTFAYRLIIPVFMFGRPVSFTARDVTDEQEPRYKNMSNDASIVPIKQCLYNIDNAGDTMVIVEGVFDAWRIGDGAVATLGTKFTMPQIKMIIDKKPKTIYVLYDKGAGKEATKLALTLSPHIKELEIIEIDEKDPAEMSEKAVKLLRKELGLLVQ
jgi:DNA primase